MAKKMFYHHTYEHEKDKMKDLFNSSNYLHLQKIYVIINGKQQNYKFFSGWNDTALSLSTDGFTPFKKHKYTCWAITVFLYNLPPDI